MKLTVDGKSYTQPLTMKMDPRIKASEADLEKQFEMEMSSVEGMNESYETLRQVQSLRAQLKERSGTTKTMPAKLKEGIQALDTQLAEMEGAAQSAFFGVPPSGAAGENLSTLNQHFAGLLAVADSADAAPTTQAAAAYQEMQSALETLLARWRKLRQNELATLNTSLKKAGLAEVDPRKGSANQPGDDSDSEDQP
ncbi:MAG TPA: hypothetical protein VND65_07260 [Candidatus Binatia bacterium]|nr:hypothetical protein [Candidatus Binatia bacterium]